MAPASHALYTSNSRACELLSRCFIEQFKVFGIRWALTWEICFLRMTVLFMMFMLMMLTHNIWSQVVAVKSQTKIPKLNWKKNNWQDWIRNPLFVPQREHGLIIMYGPSGGQRAWPCPCGTSSSCRLWVLHATWGSPCVKQNKIIITPQYVSEIVPQHKIRFRWDPV